MKELSAVVKMPKKKENETIFSSQEATQLIFMDSESEGDEEQLAHSHSTQGKNHTVLTGLNKVPYSGLKTGLGINEF